MRAGCACPAPRRAAPLRPARVVSLLGVLDVVAGLSGASLAVLAVLARACLRPSLTRRDPSRVRVFARHGQRIGSDADGGSEDACWTPRARLQAARTATKVVGAPGHAEPHAQRMQEASDDSKSEIRQCANSEC